ncbi:hypothetical protein [Salibacterium aidingense]|uniref:hypothetical protein n=1 Tax=Salibacterium aidingense TaxID=384933 RepID=UPI003BEDACCE
MNIERFNQVSEMVCDGLKELVHDAEVIGVSLDATRATGPKLKFQVYEETQFFDLAGEKLQFRTREGDRKFPYEAFFQDGDIEVLCLITENNYQKVQSKEEADYERIS